MKIEALYQLYKKHPIIVTDTREIKPNSIFFALKGDNFNGNKYAVQAISKGAKYAVVDQDIESKDHSIIRVENVLNCLQKLANFHRNQFQIPVIGITGTNGKTTTKELLYTVLSTKYNVLATEGNFNNHIGVPLTLLRITNQHNITIIEMGANHNGEIKDLCNISEPTIGLVTNVGIAHLEGFGSIKNIIQTKSDLYRFVQKKSGVNFLLSENKNISDYLNNDNKFIKFSNSDSNIENYGYGNVENLLLKFKLQNLHGYSGKPIMFSTKMVGLYNQSNILAAITIANYFDVSIELIVNALENYTPNNNRSQLKKTLRNELILDAYNANPTSVENAIINFKNINHPNKLLILGDMFELGESSQEQHQKIIELIDNSNINSIVIGNAYWQTQTSSSKIIKYQNIDQFINSNTIQKIDDSFILLKGSRGMQLERLIDFL